MGDDQAQDEFSRQHPGRAQGRAMGGEEAPALWNAGTYWRFLSTHASTSGRPATFEEPCPPGAVAPPHVHDDEEEAFFVLEGSNWTRDGRAPWEGGDDPRWQIGPPARSHRGQPT